MLRSGQPAPDFEAQSTLDKSIHLSDYRGKPVILFFFPKAFTPG
jgi:peroxiredoxin Q/BCP